jgi:hypothetical protein
MDSAEIECRIRQFAAEALQNALAQSVAPLGGVSRAPLTETPEGDVEYEPLAPARCVGSLELEEFFRSPVPWTPNESDTTSVEFGTFAPAQEGTLSGGGFSWAPFPYPMPEEAGDVVVNLGTFEPSQNVTLAPWANFMRGSVLPESPMQRGDLGGADSALSALSSALAASERSAVRRSSSVGSKFGGGLRRVDSAPALLEVGRAEKSKGAVRFDQKEDSPVDSSEEDLKVVRQGDIQWREAAEGSPKAALEKAKKILPPRAAACGIKEILPSAQPAEPSILRTRRQEASFAPAKGPRFGNNGYFSLKPASSAPSFKPTSAKRVTAETNRQIEPKPNSQTKPSPVETMAQCPGESSRAPAQPKTLSFVEDELARQRALFAAANLRNRGGRHVPAPGRWTGPGFVAVAANVGAFVAGVASWI